MQKLYRQKHNQSAVGAGDLGIRGPGASKLTRLQINTKSVRANMMNISTESLSLIEDLSSYIERQTGRIVTQYLILINCFIILKMTSLS